jgi:hypothetical protein
VSAADPGVIHKTPVADRGPCSTDAALIPIDALAPPFPAYRCFYAGRRLRSKVRKFYRDDFEYFSSLGFEYVI